MQHYICVFKGVVMMDEKESKKIIDDCLRAVVAERKDDIADISLMDVLKDEEFDEQDLQDILKLSEAIELDED